MRDDKLIDGVRIASTACFSSEFRGSQPPPALMALDLDQVRRIAHLARIEITDGEAQRTLEQLSDIFAMIERMRAVDTTGIEPMAHPLGGHQRLRDDVVTESDERAGNLANAPEQQDGLFLVPRVIE
jgi:aspartyl-tRNA(Asn)/glutamyl-tRNA(Gln) amidotransferase subunit C